MAYLIGLETFLNWKEGLGSGNLGNLLGKEFKRLNLAEILTLLETLREFSKGGIYFWFRRLLYIFMSYYH